MSSELFKLYRTDDVVYDCPIGNSDHKVITACPKFPQNILKQSQHSLRHVYDFRKSNVDFLHSIASNVDWTRVLDADDVDDKGNNLNWKYAMKEVYITNSDKQWITPLVKLLINDR